jgi:hypothetical protein
LRDADAGALLRRGLLLEYATLGWNLVGVFVVAVAALRSRSVGLAGFGLDSLIEIFASVVVIWQLTGRGREREAVAMRLIGAAFGLLAVYIGLSLIVAFARGSHPLPSGLGLAWLAATCVAMLGLAWGKRVTGRALGSPVLVAEANVTLVDAALAFAVLVGVGLNARAGWWWADPLSGLVVLGYAVKEGQAAWRHGA